MSKKFTPTAKPVAPVIPSIPGSYSCYAGEVQDPWFGLRFLKGRKLDRVVKAEENYLARELKPLENLTKDIVREGLVRSASHPEISYPCRSGNAWMYSRMGTEQQQPVYYLCTTKPDAARVLSDEESGTPILDVNVLAKERGEEGYEVGDIAVSRDGSFIAYTECPDGGESYTLIRKNLSSGLEDTLIDGLSGDVVLVNGDAIVALLDEAKRACTVTAVNLETREQRELYHEADDSRWVGFACTLEDDWLIIESGSLDSTRSSLYRVKEHEYELVYASPDTPLVHYSIDAYSTHIIVLESKVDGTTNVMDAAGTVLIPHRDGVEITSAEIMRFQNSVEPSILVTAYSGGVSWVESWVGGVCRRIATPEGVNASVEYVDGANNEFIISTEGWVQPEALYTVNPATLEAHLLHQWAVGDYDASNYEAREMHITATDGTEVPVSLVKRVTTKWGAPALIYAYGSYGTSMDAYFSPTRVSMLDRGAIFVVVHPRGGGENGRPWHEAARRELKTRTFTDVLSAAVSLREQGLVSRMVLEGGSAGGGMVGAVANLAPTGVFQAFIAEVPFVDAMATMSDATLPLTAGEYVEWGNPFTKEGYESIAAWNPVERVQHTRYADYLIICGLNDPRVGFWEGLKLAARVREADPRNRVLVRMDKGAGHHGASGKLDGLKQTAMALAFTVKQLGLA